MKRYLVKITETPTELNANGSVHTWYEGIGETMLGHSGFNMRSLNEWEPSAFSIVQYGYKREQNAKRNWSIKHTPYHGSLWTITSEIVCYDID